MVGGFVGAAAVPNEPHGDERELVTRVQHGDREAFDELARRHARRAFAIAYRILRHTQDAEDLVQDAFIAALDGIGTFSTRLGHSHPGSSRSSSIAPSMP